MNNEKIGHFIRMLRKEKGMTQKDLAEKLHVSDRTVSKWERGAGIPDPSLMISLSDLLGINVNELLAGERNTEKEYTEETKDEIKQAVSVICQHMHAKEKKLRSRIIMTVLLIALAIAGIHLAIRKGEETRILFPPKVTCELLQKDIDMEATLLVDQRDTGVYDYICAYDLDRYGDLRLKNRSLWQSYTDAVPSEVYKNLKKLCPGEITRIDATDTGYLVCAYQGPATAVITETDHSFQILFQYEFLAENGLSTAFVSEDTLYILAFHREDMRTYVTAVNKKTGKEQVSHFAYSDFAPDADAEDSMAGFLFDKNNMWVKNGILHFAETYYKGGPTSIFGAYDLNRNRAVAFEKIENAQVVMTYKEPDLGQVAVLINPMGYQPLKLYTLDDTTMEVRTVTQLELPNEYLTWQNSDYAAETYYLFEGDMDEGRVAVLFGDIVSRENLDNDIASCILVVYDRTSGHAVWRGRFMMDTKYEICGIVMTSTE